MKDYKQVIEEMPELKALKLKYWLGKNPNYKSPPREDPDNYYETDGVVAIIWDADFAEDGPLYIEKNIHCYFDDDCCCANCNGHDRSDISYRVHKGTLACLSNGLGLKDGPWQNPKHLEITKDQSCVVRRIVIAGDDYFPDERDVSDLLEKGFCIRR